MIGRTLAFIFALSLALVASPIGPFSASDTAEAAPYCAFPADDPEGAVDAARCTAYVVSDCVKDTAAGDPCAW